MSYKAAIQKKAKAKNFLVSLLKLNGFAFRNIGLTAFSVYSEDRKTLDDQIKSCLSLYDKNVYCGIQCIPRSKCMHNFYSLYKVVILGVDTDFDAQLIQNLKDKFYFICWNQFPNRVAEGKFDSKNRTKIVLEFGKSFCQKKNKNFNQFKIGDVFVTILKNTIIID